MTILAEALLWDILGVVVALLATGYAYFKWSYQYWSKKNVPFLEPTVPFGNMANPFRGREGVAQRIRRLYDDATTRGWKHCGMYNLSRPTYLATDLEMIKRIMTKDFSHFVDRGLYYNEKDDPVYLMESVQGNPWTLCHNDYKLFTQG